MNIFYKPQKLVENCKWFILNILLVTLSFDGFSQVPQSASANDNLNKFTITKSSSHTDVGPGGVTVSYTYKIKNISSANLYYVSASDDKITGITYTGSGFTSSGLLACSFNTLVPNAEATFTATANITQTTENTFSVTMGSRIPLLCFNGPQDRSTATVKLKVTVVLPVGALSCNTLYFSSDDDATSLGASDGKIGTVTSAAPITATTVYDVATLMGSPTSTLDGSAAVAIDPVDPTIGYFMARTDITGTATYGGLMRLNLTTGVATEVVTTANAPNIVRLTVAPDRSVWTVDGAGVVYQHIPGTSTFPSKGTILIPVGSTLAWSSLGSGDIAFDGDATMYIIASDQATGTAKLMTVTKAELLDGSPQAVLVGDMGTGSFNGIAFTEDGKAYASAITNATGGTSTTTPKYASIFSVNIANGSTTYIGTISSPTTAVKITDLGSCALPQADLQVAKSVSPSGRVAPGTVLTYTTTIKNIGTLVSTSTTFTDVIPANTTLVAGSTKLNGTAHTDYITAQEVHSAGNLNGVISPGATCVVEFKVTTSSTFTGTICNSGIVKYTGNTDVVTDDTTLPGGTDATCITSTPKYTIAGNVFNDVNGATNVDGIGIGTVEGVQLYASLIGPTGSIEQTVPVSAAGAYTFAATFPDTYTVVIHTTSIGSATPSLPNNWTNVSEDCCDNTGNDGTTNGTATVVVSNANLTNVNFGIVGPDKDGDGVTDISDLDDDNDGILDTLECGILNPATGGDGNINFSKWNLVGLPSSDPFYNSLTQHLNPATQNIKYGDVPGTTILPTSSGTVAVNMACCPGITPFYDENTSLSVGHFAQIEGFIALPCYSTLMIRVINNGDPAGVGVVRENYSTLHLALNGGEPSTDPNFLTKVSQFKTNFPGTVLSNTEYTFPNTSSSGQWIRFADVVSNGAQKYGTVIQWNINGAGWVNVPVSSFSSTPTGLIAGCKCADTDNDGIPNSSDLDSDGDGCPDAIEGGSSTINNSNLVNSTLNGGNTGTGYTGSSTSPVVQNLGNTVGTTFNTSGVPTIAGTGQTVGSSQDKNVNGCSQPVSGNVFNDTNYGNVDGTGTNAGGLNANLLNSAGQVVAKVAVNPDGTYTFPSVVPGSYSVQISTIAGTVGSPAPVQSLPAGFTNTGDFNGVPGTGTNTTSINGVSEPFTVASSPVTNINFGITQFPSVAGNVYNDINGANVDGTGIQPGNLNAILVNSAGNIIATVPVNASGSYNFANVPPGDYSVRISTTSGTVGSAAPAPSLPTGWVNTGEFNGSPNTGNDGDKNGISPTFTVGTTNITNVNFGIEQPPTTNTATAPSTLNPAGTVPSANMASQFGGTDPSGGIISSIKITAFPSNATSITIGTTTYCNVPAAPTCVGTPFPVGGITLPTNATGQPSVVITVDPIDGAVTVGIPYKTIDNAGVESTNPGAVNVPFTTTSLSGTVFNDVNAGTVGGTGTNAGGLFANLLDGANNVVASTPVAADGTYNFPNLNGGTYSVSIGTTAGTVGSPAPTTLPTGWLNTGEFNGTPNTGTDALVNGTSVPVTVTATPTTNINFGIQQPPTPLSETAASQMNPGGTTSATVPPTTFGATDPNGGTITAIRITGFPTNATSISINGTTYCNVPPALTCVGTAFPSGGVTVPTNAAGEPTQPILVDPINGNVVVDIPYKAIDNAGAESPTSATASVPFTLGSLAGNVFNDLGGLLADNTVNGTGTNAGGLFANLLDASGNVVTSVPVAANGTYTFTDINGGTYSVAISTTAGTPGSPVTPSLPAGWVNTGENNSTAAGSDGTINGRSTPVTISPLTPNITNVNFGIEQPPVATSETLPGVTNPGGTANILIPPTAFNTIDPSGGTVTSIRIDTMPTGATSITVNGTTYTSIPVGGITVPVNPATGEPTQTIAVDPIDGVQLVNINYVPIDNAGIVGNIATVTQPLGYSISGKLWDNGNNGNVQDVGEPTLTDAGATAPVIATGGSPMYAVLTNATTGATILDPNGNPLYSEIQPNGTYLISGVPNGSYNVVLTATNPTSAVGNVTPNTGSADWVMNGNSSADIDTGIIPVTMSSNNIINQDFGLDNLPESFDINGAEQTNNGGNNFMTAPTLAGTDREDSAKGAGDNLVITTFPTNTDSFRYNGVVYTTANFPVGGVPITNYNPTLLQVNPNFNGAGTVTFTYAFVDDAGKIDPTPATVVMPFTANQLVINVFNDTDGMSNTLVDGTPISAADAAPLFVVIKDAGGAIISTEPVINGTVIFGDENDEQYQANTTYIISITSNSAGTTNVLPTGWVGTGESAIIPATDPTDGDQVITVTSLANSSNDPQVVNLGIDKRPTATNETLPSAVNPGGTGTLPIPPTAFLTADADGAPLGNGVTSVTITQLPTIVTSITVNGTTYTSGNFPPGGILVPTNPTSGQPTVPISYDPLDNITQVVLTYLPTDAAGKVGLTPATITIPFQNPLKLTGTVFNDIDALTDNTVDGTSTGTLGTTPMYVNLIGLDGKVVQVVPVNANGTYQFNDLFPSTNYQVVLTTAPGTVGQAAPAPSLPTGFVNTGEDCCDNTGTDGTPNGILPVTMGTVDQANANLGAQQLPTAGTATAASVLNPGGTNPSTVPATAFSGTDQDGGTVDKIIITAFPTNATSITIGGTTYTLGNFPANGVTINAPGGVPSVPISVDPADGNVIVSIPYKTVDNAGAISTIPGVVNIPYYTASITGTVFDDANGATTGGIVDGTPTNAGGLFATLLDGTGAVVQSVPVAADGTYTFSGVNEGNYSVIINPASSASSPGLPPNWVNTGENIGGGTGIDGTKDGKNTPIVINSTNTPPADPVFDKVDFGIEQKPDANDATATAQVNPGGTTAVPVPTLVLTDPEDGTPTTVTIETLPANGTVLYNGNPVVAGTPIPNFNPALLTVDPNDGAQTVVFTYSTTDKAGVKSDPATVTMPFTALKLSGTVFNDPDGAIDNNVDGTGTNAGGLFANLVSGGLVVATVPVNSDGTYQFSNLNAGTYTVQISSNQGTVGSAAPANALPSTFANTGDEIGTAQGTTPNGVSEPVILSSTDVTDVNFGIQQPPVANNVTAAGQLNPGGNVKVPVTPLSVTDPEDGTPTTITIETLPTNGTLNYGTNLVTPGQVIPNFNPALLTVDPNPGVQNVVFTYSTTDAAGAKSPPATVTMPFNALNLSGNVFVDGNGSTDGVDGSAYSAGGLNANLIGSDGKVLASTPVSASGTYTFTGIDPGTYTVQISTVAGVPTQNPPLQTLPSTYGNTGDEIGATQGTTPNGVSEPVVLTTSNVTDVNFGIQQPPVANPVTATSQPNPGGNAKVPVPPLSVTDPEDGTPSTVTITQLPTNGTLYYDGNPVVAGTPIPNFNPAKLTVDPNDGAITVVFQYTTTDAAGVTSPPANVTIPFTTLSIAGSVFNDANGSTDLDVNGSVYPAGDLNANLIDQATGKVVATVPVATDGTYTFTGLSGGTYLAQISTVKGVPTQSPPAQTLPGSFGNTGDEIGTTQSATPNGLSEPITLSTTNITEVNFGIQQPPVANPVTAGIQPNPGGITQVPVPPLSVTDPEDGTPKTITIVTLPTNGTLYYNGIPVEAGKPIPDFDPNKLTVDPNDGAVTVTFPYTTTDAAGVISPPANVSIPFETCDLEIGGIIYVDKSGTDDGVTGTPVKGTTLGLYMTLVQGTTIINKQAISETDGSYKFTAVPAGTYSLVLTTNPNGSLTKSLPTSYVTVSEGGESTVGGFSAGDGTPDGKTTIAVNCNNILFEVPSGRRAAIAGTAATGSYLDNDFGINNPGALPVDLVDFKGKQFEKQINLTWKVANEKEFSHFEVQRSGDSKEFGSIGKVDGKNQSFYNFADKNPKNGVNYYRLKMVDLDGSAKLSNVISINFEAESEYISVENPAINGEFKVITNVQNAKYTLMNSLGKTIDTQISDLGNGKLSFKVVNSVSGYYFLNIESNGKFKTKKVIIP